MNSPTSHTRIWLPPSTDKTVILVIGLPGSGKSTLLKSWEARGASIVDDASVECEDITKTLGELVDTNLVVIADVQFCSHAVRFAAHEIISTVLPEHFVMFLYLANEPEICKENVRRRATLGDTRKVNDMIDLLAKDYHPPPNSLPVYGGNYRLKGFI